MSSWLKAPTELDNLEECSPLEDGHLCLVGCTSLSAFCTYKTKSIRSKFLQTRFYTHGRCYIPSNSSHESGLYTVCQRTNVHLCLAAASTEQLMSIVRFYFTFVDICIRSPLFRLSRLLRQGFGTDYHGKL